jgi:ABC-type sugar transport system ATPase subunit
VPEPAVRFERITKRYLGVRALRGVSPEVAAGARHALCEANGAGKSTLEKILDWIYAPDEGRLVIQGREVHFDSPRDAAATGVGVVHQELAFRENLSVAENLCLGALPSRPRVVDRGRMRRRGMGVNEIRIHTEIEHRVLYVAKCAEAVSSSRQAHSRAPTRRARARAARRAEYWEMPMTALNKLHDCVPYLPALSVA